MGCITGCRLLCSFFAYLSTLYFLSLGQCQLCFARVSCLCFVFIKCLTLVSLLLTSRAGVRKPSVRPRAVAVRSYPFICRVCKASSLVCRHRCPGRTAVPQPAAADRSSSCTVARAPIPLLAATLQCLFKKKIAIHCCRPLRPCHHCRQAMQTCSSPQTNN